METWFVSQHPQVNFSQVKKEERGRKERRERRKRKKEEKEGKEGASDQPVQPVTIFSLSLSLSQFNSSHSLFLTC